MPVATAALAGPWPSKGLSWWASRNARPSSMSDHLRQLGLIQSRPSCGSACHGGPMPYTKFVRGSLLLVGLTLYGVSDAMLVLAGLGLDPWDVLHQGLSRSVGGQVGTWTDIIGVIVLLGWIPLRQRPG